MDEIDQQIQAELAELEALDAADARGEYVPLPVNAVPPPPEGWFPCPCCGHQTFGEIGEYEICAVCFWEDDLYQLRVPWAGVGANGVCLMEAQANYRRYGAMEERFVTKVRPAAPDEPLDPGFRPVDLTRDSFEGPQVTREQPVDLSGLYWWRPDYWRRDEPPTGQFFTPHW
ncbi:CPCC family cysteine-rich protein [Streptomyces katsurahamanus]|uniref:Hydrolase n=1 Tax=Streptomyces katsurahamanus TaxID=2577098 RepID=A0ABW9NQE3_9ACTN|nr:CPCC family cysteine-rich protein [Streptomyces katsurahamanus]MQS35124.1 hydrolase [Streptomyces katsurahamanus]